MDTALEFDADEAEIEKLLEEGEVEEKESGELDDDLLDDELNDDLLESPEKIKNTEQESENHQNHESVQKIEKFEPTNNQETFQSKLQKSFQETFQKNVQKTNIEAKTQKSVQNGVYSRPTEQKQPSEIAHFTTSDMRKVLESVDQLRNINKQYAEEVEHLKEIANVKVQENLKLKKERKKYKSKCQDLQTELENEQNKSCISCAMSSTMLNNLNKENAELADKVEELEMKLMAYQSLRTKKPELMKIEASKADLRESLSKRSFDGISDTFSEKSSNSVINGGKFSAGNFKMAKLKRTVIVKQKKKQ
jgi:hypothetical protein